MILVADFRSCSLIIESKNNSNNSQVKKRFPKVEDSSHRTSWYFSIIVPTALSLPEKCLPETLPLCMDIGMRTMLISIIGHLYLTAFAEKLQNPIRQSRLFNLGCHASLLLHSIVIQHHFLPCSTLFVYEQSYK